jgi:hypothetical protein
MFRFKFNKIILVIIGIITLAMGILIFIYPPAIFPDSSTGFQVMRSMQMGGHFNLLIGPDATDISKNTSQYITWWSPGQYLIPYIIKSILGINTGKASAITIILFELSGLTGFYVFFKKIGFTPIISAISLAFIATQQAFLIPYVFYNGGEVLLFGFEGWFLYGCISLEKPGIKLLAFVLLSGWIGFLCKSSFIWIYAAGLLCLWLRLCVNKASIGNYIKNGIWIAVPAVLSLAAIYIFFLAKGSNPVSTSAGYDLSWQALSFPLGSPLLAGFSVDDLAHGLVFHPWGAMFTPGHIAVILSILAIISLVLVISIILYVPKNNYRLFVMVFYTASILFFGWVFIKQLSITYEGRHFRIIGLLIVPGTIYLFSKFKPAWQILFVVLCAGIAITNYSYFIKGFIFNKNVSAHGSSGMSQQYIDQPSLNRIMQLDKENNNAIFAFLSPDLGLEILHNRIITIEPPPPGIPIDFDDYEYDGHAGPLYVLLPATYNGTLAATILKFFPGYSDFKAEKLSRGYMLYSAK